MRDRNVLFLLWVLLFTMQVIILGLMWQFYIVTVLIALIGFLWVSMIKDYFDNKTNRKEIARMLELMNETSRLMVDTIIVSNASTEQITN